MATCGVCKQNYTRDAFATGANLCPTCNVQNLTTSSAHASAEIEAIILTTEAHIPNVERLGIVATEVVLGMNLFKDALANLRDIFGGRSGVVQNTLADAREAAFDELRLKAIRLGADAVIAVDIDYHTLTTTAATNMMMVAVSGTAVRMNDTKGLMMDNTNTTTGVV